MHTVFVHIPHETSFHFLQAHDKLITVWYVQTTVPQLSYVRNPLLQTIQQKAIDEKLQSTSHRVADCKILKKKV